MNILEFYNRGSMTTRFHCYNLIKCDTVGRHSHGVAFFVWYLMSEAPPMDRLPVLQNALFHDMAEFEVGDVPAPTKRRLNIRHKLHDIENAVLSQVGVPMAILSEAQEAVLSMADCLDGLAFCLRELEMGNLGMVKVVRTYFDYLETALDGPEIEEEWFAAALNKTRSIMTMFMDAMGEDE